MTSEEFIKEIEKLNINYSREMLDKLEIYKDYLIEYNSHTNITAIKEEKEIYLKHFYDSITLSITTDFLKVNTLLDIGTGAGVPGLVL